MEENVLTKKCSKCGRELPLSRFSKCVSLKDGLQKTCKECASLYNKERYKAKASEKEERHLMKVFSNPELAKFQPRELVAELRARGYSGELSIRQVITV
jgi:hypothetical protein